VKQAIARITGQMEAPPLPVIRMSLPAASLLLRGDEDTRLALMGFVCFQGQTKSMNARQRWLLTRTIFCGSRRSSETIASRLSWVC
jgi:hypothetical protein